ncbi:hypothetical protein CH373_05735 [Leptospira perolatii]|uniref:DUF1795 domain-containing protein n=1 Tax=Leptospira perolatii TaxID=2023191 RepID=A0A2M9ZR01_9LEPT|nr:hypothetical protein [Leptospira perolatii]PJZ70565.1 hypothetical protein CH360_06155 [Leptospira perolatii]PJZ74401.1 hypothetical protein CH373_05735 [Leptospira perolatii]
MKRILKNYNISYAFQRVRFILLYLVVLAALVQCASFSLDTPEGFAQYPDNGWSKWRSISPDGVRVLVEKVPNEPQSDLSLWSQSMKLHMEQQGYKLLKEEGIKTSSGLDGKQFLSVYRHGNRDYQYFAAFFVKGKSIYVIEATGPYDSFESRKEQLQKAIRSFEPKFSLF